MYRCCRRTFIDCLLSFEWGVSIDIWCGYRNLGGTVGINLWNASSSWTLARCCRNCSPSYPNTEWVIDFFLVTVILSYWYTVQFGSFCWILQESNEGLLNLSDINVLYPTGETGLLLHYDRSVHDGTRGFRSLAGSGTWPLPVRTTVSAECHGVEYGSHTTNYPL